MRKVVVKLYKRFCYWLSVLWRALLLLLIDVVLLFLYDSPSFYRDEYAREELKKECSLVQGVVYDVHTGKGNHYINYSFSIKGKEYKGVSRYGAWEHICRIIRKLICCLSILKLNLFLCTSGR